MKKLCLASLLAAFAISGCYYHPCHRATIWDAAAIAVVAGIEASSRPDEVVVTAGKADWSDLANLGPEREVVVTLRNGMEHTGKIAEVSDDKLRLQHNEEIVVLLFADILSVKIAPERHATGGKLAVAEPAVAKR